MSAGCWIIGWLAIAALFVLLFMGAEDDGVFDRRKK